jgi:hypothetical protein
MDDVSNPVDGVSGVVASLHTWARTPFSVQMDLMHWFLWTGLVLVMVIAWIMIIREADKLV